MVDCVWAVVVARVGNGPKSRLAGVLAPPDRRHLVLKMLSHVLDTCRSASPPLEGFLAVLDDLEAGLLAERAGAVVVGDPGLGDMNAAVAAGIQCATRMGATTVIVLPGDVPLISTEDVRALVDAAGAASKAVVVGASRDGDGTNALLLRPPSVIVPAFGPPSVAPHVEAALTSGARTRVLWDLGLALDVDTPADLRTLDQMSGRNQLTTLSRGRA
jgi:2-phospho-L-lactate guanylyltransferase